MNFDTAGFRKDFALEVLELTPGGMFSIGTWNVSEGYTINRKYSPDQFEVSILPEEDDLKHTHFTIIICLVSAEDFNFPKAIRNNL